MADPNLTQRLALPIGEGLIDLGERVIPLNNATEGRVLAVEVLEVLRERKEELAPAPALVPLACDSHRECPEGSVLELLAELGHKVL